MSTKTSNTGKFFSSQVSDKERRKLKALKSKKKSEWSGLGLFGMIGWSISIPTLLGTSLGVYLDKKFPETFSWTLTFLIIGLAAGCVIAWQWIGNEHKDINDEEENNE